MTGCWPSMRGSRRQPFVDAMCGAAQREIVFSLLPVIFLVLAAFFMNDWQEVSKTETSKVIMLHSVGSLRENIAGYFTEKQRVANYLQQLIRGGIWTDPSDLKTYARHIVPIVSLHSSYKTVDCAVGDIYDASVVRSPNTWQAVTDGSSVVTVMEQHFHYKYARGMYTRTHRQNFVIRSQEIQTNYDPETEPWMLDMTNSTTFKDYMYRWTLPYFGKNTMHFQATWPFSHGDPTTTYFGVTYMLDTLRDITQFVPADVHVAVFDRFTGRVIVYNKQRDSSAGTTVWQIGNGIFARSNLQHYFIRPTVSSASVLLDNAIIEVSPLQSKLPDGVYMNYNAAWLIITSAPLTWHHHPEVAANIVMFFRRQYDVMMSLKFIVTARLLDDEFDIVSAERIVLPLLKTHTDVETIQMTSSRTTLKFYRVGFDFVTEVHHTFPDDVLDPKYLRFYTANSRFDDWTTDGKIWDYPHAVNMRNAVWYGIAKKVSESELRWVWPWDLTDEGKNHIPDISLVFRVLFPRTDDVQALFRFQFSGAEIMGMLDNLDVGVNGASAVVTKTGVVVAINAMSKRDNMTGTRKSFIWDMPEFSGLGSKWDELLNDPTNDSLSIGNGRQVLAMPVTETFWLFLSLSDDILTTAVLADKVVLGGLTIFVFILVVVNGVYFAYNVNNVVSMDIALLHLSRHNPDAVRGIVATNLSTNNEIRRMQRAVLKLKSALELYMSYLPQRASDGGDNEEGGGERRGLLTGDGDDHEMILHKGPEAVRLIFVAIHIHSIHANLTNFSLFFKRVCEFVCPIIKMASGTVTSLHHGSITAVWDPQKRSETLTRNVYSQCIGCLMSLAKDFHDDVASLGLQTNLARLMCSPDVKLNIVACAGEGFVGNVGSDTTKEFSVFGAVRVEANRMADVAHALQEKFGPSRSVVLIDEACHANITGKLLCREVISGKVWSPYTYDPSVMPSTSECIASHAAYHKYFGQCVRNIGTPGRDADFHTLTSDPWDAVSNRLVSAYDDPSARGMTSI